MCESVYGYTTHERGSTDSDEVSEKLKEGSRRYKIKHIRNTGKLQPRLGFLSQIYTFVGGDVWTDAHIGLN